jgi:hypothetical protein
MGQYTKAMNKAENARALAEKKVKAKKSTPALNIRHKVNSGELSVKAAMNKLLGVPGGRDTSAWTWLQNKMKESK